MNPTAAAEREPILDVLRGFAVLGILLVNIQLMRGPDWFVLVGGEPVASTDGFVDRIVQFAIGWLATGKLVSSLAILFGIGAALIAARSLRAGESPRALLARRYVGLMAFGIAHMALYPGDILFVYGVTGIALLPFVMLPVRALLWWSVGIFAAFSAFGLTYLLTIPDASAYVDASAAESVGTALQEKRAQAIAAFTSGSYRDIVSVHVWQAFILQGIQLGALPWILALFLLGYAVGRAGILGDLRAHRTLLRRGAWIGLAVGLPANIGTGLTGPLAGWGPVPETEPPWVTRWTSISDLIGEPVLAVGYLCALALVCLRRGPIYPLAAVGRMALTAYVLQSALALAVFGGLHYYDRLSSTSVALVALGIWAVLLVVCPLWLRCFALGPAEWLWRSLTYGRVPAMRIRRDRPL